jgi:hypothetical protein
VVVVLGELIEDFVDKIANSAFAIAKHRKRAEAQKVERARSLAIDRLTQLQHCTAPKLLHSTYSAF